MHAHLQLRQLGEGPAVGQDAAELVVGQAEELSLGECGPQGQLAAEAVVAEDLDTTGSGGGSHWDGAVARCQRAGNRGGGSVGGMLHARLGRLSADVAG